MKFVKIVLSVIITLSVLITSIVAFAYDAEYLDPAKWMNCDSENITINQTSVFGQLVGKYSYLVDNDDSCLYITFAVQEDNIDSNDDVKIGFVVDSGVEEYEFSVDANGEIVSNVDLKDKFVAHSRFETYSSNNGSYTVALNINNGSKLNYITVYFMTKARYTIDGLDNIMIKTPEKSKSTTKTKKAISTTKKKNKPTTKKSTTKKHTTQKATKYYNPNPTQPANNTVADEEDVVADSTTIVDNTPNVSQMYSKSYTMGIIGASVLGTVGFMLVLFGLISKSKKKEDTDLDDIDLDVD